MYTATHALVIVTKLVTLLHVYADMSLVLIYRKHFYIEYNQVGITQ